MVYVSYANFSELMERLSVVLHKLEAAVQQNLNSAVSIGCINKEFMRIVSDFESSMKEEL